MPSKSPITATSTKSTKGKRSPSAAIDEAQGVEAPKAKRVKGNTNHLAQPSTASIQETLPSLTFKCDVKKIVVGILRRELEGIAKVEFPEFHKCLLVHFDFPYQASQALAKSPVALPLYHASIKFSKTTRLKGAQPTVLRAVMPMFKVLDALCKTHVSGARELAWNAQLSGGVVRFSSLEDRERALAHAYVVFGQRIKLESPSEHIARVVGNLESLLWAEVKRAHYPELIGIKWKKGWKGATGIFPAQGGKAGKGEKGGDGDSEKVKSSPCSSSLSPLSGSASPSPNKNCKPSKSKKD